MKDEIAVPTMGAEDAPDAIYDARVLGRPKMLVFGLQHMFAMFGATVLVPTITGLSVSATLLFAGLGTLLFHLISKGKVPAFLGSSFAFIAGYAAVAPLLPDEAGNLTVANTELLPYACLGVACAGLLYLVLSALFRAFGAARVMRYFPPVVTGPIVIAIGLTLSSSAVANCQTNWLVAVVAIVTIIVFNIWGKGMLKIIPILLGVIAGYVCAVALGLVDFTPVAEASWVGLPVLWENTVFALAGPGFDTGLAITAIITIMPPLAFLPRRSYTSATFRPSAPPATATTSPSPACIAPCWATALPRFWRRSSARRPTPPTARTPACSRSRASSTPASSASQPASRCSSPSAPSFRRSSRSCPPA